MIPRPFAYEVAESVEHAVDLLAGDPDARPLAGGHSLLPLMKLRTLAPTLLVDLGRLDGLAYIRAEGDQVSIGALTTYRHLQTSPVLLAECPVLARASALVADPQVRNRGTIGGAVAYGDPSADVPAVLAGLRADLVVQGRRGVRVERTAEFFRGPQQTSLAPGDVLVEIRVPRLGRDYAWSYLKFAQRAQAWPIVATAVALRRDHGGIADARIGLANMGPVPLRAEAAERVLLERGPAGADEAGAHAADGASPPSDVFGSAEYRSHLARVLVGRAIREALERSEP